MIVRKSHLLIIILALLGGSYGVARKSTLDKKAPISCKLQTIFDSQSRSNAFVFFMPKGWANYSHLSWGREPGTFHISVSASTSDGRYEATQTGNETYNYNVFYNFQGGPPRYVNTPVHHATDYLKVVLGQISQSDGISDIQVVDSIDSPLAASKVPAWLKNAPIPAWEQRVSAYESGYLQLKFNRDGHPMTAMLGTTVKGYSGKRVLPGKNFVASEGGFFMVGPTTLLIMPADSVEQKQRELKIVADSIRMTPQFHEYLNQLTDHLVKMKLGAAAAAQKYDAATFHERAMSQFGQQMRMKDAYSHAFCNYVSDQQDYKDQGGRIVTVPSNYKYAWSDGSGNYLLNDDPTIDMRGIGNGNWKPMEKANIGD